jgi:hypothetical protein
MSVALNKLPVRAEPAERVKFVQFQVVRRRVYAGKPDAPYTETYTDVWALDSHGRLWVRYGDSGTVDRGPTWELIPAPAEDHQQ